MIRKMKIKDIEEIKQIDKLCFNVGTERTTEGIRGYIESSNNSSIVYEVNNKVVGFNFIHIWGSFAWFGPFGVHPEYQGNGIGKAIINYTIKILKEEFKVSTIGLNTMPESQYNVGFYMNLGFTPLKLSLSLKKQLDSLYVPKLRYSEKYSVKELDISDKERYLTLKEDLKYITSKMLNDFDLSSELLIIKNEKFGTIFLLEEYKKIHGIVICYTKSIREDSSRNLHIKLAIIDNSIDYKKAIDSIIDFCIIYAQNIKYKSISNRL